MEYCLPKYRFFVLDDTGWNFKYGKFHQENRRTLTKAYGLKFILKTSGRGGRFDLTNAVIIIANFLGVLGIISMIYDWIVINCPSDMRAKIIEAKYDIVEKSDTEILLKHSLAAITSIGVMPNQCPMEQAKEKDSTALETIRSMMTLTSVGVCSEKCEKGVNKTESTTQTSRSNKTERMARSERLI